MKFTPENITSLEPHQVFCFGSNLDGIHGAGAARIAREKFGAQMGVGAGLTGQCYALPTCERIGVVSPLGNIKYHVERLIECAVRNPDKEFLVTKIGCGIAGYAVNEIAHLFAGERIPSNVVLPKEFHDHLNQGNSL